MKDDTPLSEKERFQLVSGTVSIPIYRVFILGPINSITLSYLESGNGEFFERNMALETGLNSAEIKQSLHELELLKYIQSTKIKKSPVVHKYTINTIKISEIYQEILGLVHGTKTLTELNRKWELLNEV